MTQIFDRFFEEFVFGHVPIHLVFTKDVEHLSDMLLVIGFVLAVDQDIINVHNNANIQEWSEDVLD